MSDQDTQQKMDFGQILAEFEQDAPAKKEGPAVGEKVSGTVLSIGEESAFVDLGSKSEAMVPVAELKDAEGNLTVQVGDTIEATVAGTDPATGAFLLRRKAGAKGKKTQEVPAEIRQSMEAGLPVEGTVTGINKGGAEVQVMGLRAFCPLSQLDLRYVEDPTQFVGQKLLFRIDRLEEGNRGGRGPNLVLSRRALLEAERQNQAAETREKLKVGAILRGKITSLTTYGAFVDLGGIEGMLHVSEIGHTRTGHPQDVFQLGEEIEVQVLKIEAGKDDKRPERISLSRRALERDPWKDVAERFPEGTTMTGRVMRLESFGAFIQLAPGIEGLVHISEIGAGRRLNHSKEALNLGQDVEVKVIGVDLTRRRVSLSIAALQEGYVPPDRDFDRPERGPAPERGRSAGGAGRGPGGGGGGRGGGGGDRGRGGDRGGDRGRGRREREEDLTPREPISISSGSGFGSMADFFKNLRKEG